MNSLNPIANNTFKNTYDVTSKQYSSDYIPYNSEQDLSSKDMQERLSKSPPIIICQIGDRENPVPIDIIIYFIQVQPACLLIQKIILFLISI